ncbi:MAG: hypothetical protein IJ654_01720 [Bacteroidales bacterium]|nr:hypothetical protein [Bacteroidales bacterium]
MTNPEIVRNDVFRRFPYAHPACEILTCESDASLCQTSLGSGEIEPGTGDNWGTL